MTSFSWIPWYFKNSTHEIHGIFLIWQAGEAVLQASPDGTWTALGWKAMGPCEMPMDAIGFGWFWASKLEVSCSGNAVWQFESPLSDCCTRKGSLRTTRSIQGKLGGHAMPWHHLVVQCRSFCLGRSTKARVSPCVTLRNSSVLFGVNMCERRPL